MFNSRKLNIKIIKEPSGIINHTSVWNEHFEKLITARRHLLALIKERENCEQKKIKLKDDYDFRYQNAVVDYDFHYQNAVRFVQSLEIFKQFLPKNRDWDSLIEDLLVLSVAHEYPGVVNFNLSSTDAAILKQVVAAKRWGQSLELFNPEHSNNLALFAEHRKNTVKNTVTQTSLKSAP